MFAPRKGTNETSSQSSSPGVVLGIDPGLTRCGYAVVRPGQQPSLLALGVLTTPAGDVLPDRLGRLHADVLALLEEFSPSAVAVERVFFQHNTRTAMSVGQASGVVLALAASRGCRVVQYTPTQVKQAVAGIGAASNEEIKPMEQLRCGLRTLPTPPDAADAAALALCHIASEPFARSVAGAMAR
ncbi:MAG: crossover junction endodeoxyribonuclease RuvC [Ilumatobacteraceae bacterium]